MARDRSIGIAVTSALGVAVAGTVVIMITGVRHVPSWPTLRESPLGGVPGAIAGIRHDDTGACVVVVSPVGGDERELGCDAASRSYVDLVTWTHDGELRAITYEAGGPMTGTFDPTTGELRSVVADDLFDERQPVIPGSDGHRDSDGARVGASSDDGDAAITVTTADGQSEEILSVRGPRDYSIWQAWWSPDGQWVLAEDSEQRLLLVRASGEHEVRVVARGVSDAVWFDPAHPPQSAP